jgi:Xaa-Pro aminopeptidase
MVLNRPPSPHLLRPEDADPHRKWNRAIPAPGHMEIKTGMVFALETYCPATDGYSAARIEEEVVVTDTGCTIISLFSAEELPIANRY